MTTSQKTYVEVSDCCKTEVVESFKDNPRDHHDPIAIYTCSKCKEECEAVGICEFCFGSGVIENMTWDNDAHCYMPDGDRPCVCKIREDDEA